MASASGRTRLKDRDDGMTSISPSSSSALAVNERKVGPVGGVLASWNARRMAAGIASGWLTSALHFVNWRANSRRSVRPWATSRTSLLHEVSTIGDPPS